MFKKMAFIMRGIPGSGKSTAAHFLVEGREGIVHAVDDLHTEDGTFFWDEQLKDERYAKNLANFTLSCEAGIPVVVCDCMNLTREDYQPYIAAAEKNEYAVIFVTPQLPSVKTATERNRHGVTYEHIEEMLASYQPI